MIDHDDVFKKFGGFSGVVPAGHGYDLTGFKWRGDWGEWSVPETGAYQTVLPAYDTEYFEFWDLISAASTANERFVMVELGAGFGRWGIRGALAARRLGIKDVQVKLVEAEPQHAAWARDAVLLNGLDSEKVQVVSAAIGYSDEPLALAVSNDDLSAQNWYGQAICDYDRTETDREYFGNRLYSTTAGYNLILVPSLSLEEICENMGRIDFIDADVQGSEAEMVEQSIDFMTQNVKQIHIGTHAPEIDRQVERVFSAARWQNVWNFPCRSEADTPFGPMTFEDGVQSWINPHIA